MLSNEGMTSFRKMRGRDCSKKARMKPERGGESVGQGVKELWEKAVTSRSRPEADGHRRPTGVYSGHFDAQPLVYWLQQCHR